MLLGEERAKGRIRLKRQIITEDNRSVQVLRVPYYYQSNSDWLCFVFSLKMCLEYFKNIYKSEVVKDNTPNMSIDDLKGLTHTGEFAGTRVDQSLMNELSRRIPTIKFDLVEQYTIEQLRKNFEENLPTIVIYNCSYMINEEPGPGHAGVVISTIEDNDLIVNNHWLGAEKLIRWKDFQKGWELEYNRAIIMEPLPQTKLGVE